MNLISIDGAALALKDGYLFDGLSLGIDEGEALGLVGRNGAGKTSLLRLLAGELEADRGTIARRRGLEISILEQVVKFEEGMRLADFLLGGRSTEVARHRRLAELRDRHASAAEIERVEAEIEAAGPVSLQNRYASFCAELGLEDLDRPLSSLSGGQAKKAAIARALAPKADLVLLDEPTNHLDLETIEWLERRLQAAPFAFVLVTHDRWFLDAVSSTILEIDRRQVFRHPGNYSTYLERKAERYAALEKAENRRLANLKIELAWLNRGARARATKSERRKDDIRAMQAAALVREEAMSSFGSIESRLGKKAVEFFAAGKSYDQQPVIASLDWELLPGARVGIVGPNGSGKTTLLNLAAGRISPDAGTVVRGETVRIAYFEQSAAGLNPALSVLKYVQEHAERVRLADGSNLSAEQLLERFRFPREFQAMAVGRLSGGELRRLQLVRLLAEAPNILLLDEPTNDLDVETIELLEDYLEAFSGSLLAVSHDRAFLDRTCETLLVLDGSGGIGSFPGRYGDWVAAGRPFPGGAREANRGALPEGERAQKVERTTAATGPKKLSFAERKELEGLLEEIGGLEEEKTALETVFTRGGEPATIEAASRRYAELDPLIEAKLQRWEELAARENLR